MSLLVNDDESHKHSLLTLDSLQEYDEFMESIQTLVDLGCGSGRDLEWWATRTTREDNPQPLNIKCTGVDMLDELAIARAQPNVTYQKTNFEETIHTPGKSKFDVLWCHDAFQYALNPVATLSNWWHIASDGGMLVLVVPQTTNIRRNKLAFTQDNYSYYHYTMVNLIHMLAVSGWDCKSGFFKKDPRDPWIHAVVYKSSHEPMDPRCTSWFDLMEKKLLPDTADRSVYAHSELRQQDLVLPWLDHSLCDFSQQ